MNEANEDFGTKEAGVGLGGESQLAGIAIIVADRRYRSQWLQKQRENLVKVVRSDVRCQSPPTKVPRYCFLGGIGRPTKSLLPHVPCQRWRSSYCVR